MAIDINISYHIRDPLYWTPQNILNLEVQLTALTHFNTLPAKHGTLSLDNALRSGPPLACFKSRLQTVTFEYR